MSIKARAGGSRVSVTVAAISRLLSGVEELMTTWASEWGPKSKLAERRGRKAPRLQRVVRAMPVEPPKRDARECFDATASALCP